MGQRQLEIKNDLVTRMKNMTNNKIQRIIYQRRPTFLAFTPSFLASYTYVHQEGI